MKTGSRILSIASGPIRKDRKGTTLVLGVIYRDGLVEGILSRKVSTDGSDSTRKIIEMVSSSRFRDQVRLIGINGIALAGLNVVDIEALEKRLGLKTVVVVRRKPDPKELLKALGGLHRDTGIDVKQRIDIVRRQAAVKPILVNGMYYQSKLAASDVRRFSAQLRESLRLAHIVARGVSTGESKGRI